MEIHNLESYCGILEVNIKCFFWEKKLGWILKKFLWGWQSQSQWSSVVLMHSGFAYFCDESSGSLKILVKSEAMATKKCDVIYPKKIQQQL